MKQLIPLWLSLLLLGLLFIALVDDAHASALHYRIHYTVSDNHLDKNRRASGSDPVETCRSYAQWHYSTTFAEGSWNPDPVPTSTGDTFRCKGPSGNAGYGTAYQPSCPVGHEFDETSGTCVPTPKEPQECQEIGEFYNPEDRQCVTECPSGSSLDHFCNVLPELECNESSDDFQGTIGWGEDHRNVCSGETKCPDNHRYAFQETPEGSWEGYCISNDANPPVCPGGFDTVLMISGDSFACGYLNEDIANNPNDTSDGDSDGDGQGDLSGIAGQLQDIKGLLGKGNNTTNNINETLKGIGKSLKDGANSITEAIGNIPGGGGGNGDGNGEGDGEQENPFTWSGDPITLEVGDGLEELNAIQGEYENLIANIRAEMSAAFGSFTGSGGLEDNEITLFGHTFNAGLSRFGADLSIIGTIILFAATFLALGIIMGAKD